VTVPATTLGFVRRRGDYFEPLDLQLRKWARDSGCRDCDRSRNRRGGGVGRDSPRPNRSAGCRGRNPVVAHHVSEDDREPRLGNRLQRRRDPDRCRLLVPWGIDLPMSVGAIAMSASTIIVAANAQLLRRQTLRPDSLTVSPPVTPKEESTVDEPILETSLQTQNRNSGHVAWR